MGIFIRGVVTGFAFSLGSALFKRVSKELGFEDKKEDSDEPTKAAQTDGDSDGAVDNPQSGNE